MLGTGSSPYPQFVPPLLPDLPHSGVTPTVPHVPGIGIPTSGVQAPTPMSAYAGLGSLAVSTQGESCMTFNILYEQ